MKYYLGYYNNHEYVPIKDAAVGDSLMQVVNYTTSFTTIKKIKEDLFERKLIPNTSVRIDYVIEKGTKKKRNYQLVSSTDQIYTLESRRFFSIPGLKDCLEFEQRNPEFISALSARYINKYGYINHILSYLLSLDVNDLISILKKVLNISLSNDSKIKINRILSYVSEHANNLNLDVLDGMVESFIRSLRLNPYDTTNIFICFKRYINFKSIPAMLYLSKWLQTVINEKSNINNGYIDSDYEAVSVENTVSNFFNEIVYEFDYAKKEYKTVKGKRKIDYREFFDLAVYIEEYYRKLYEEYEEYVEEETKNYRIESPITSEDDDKEEFLEEEDFERIGTTSIEAGYNLRRRDG